MTAFGRPMPMRLKCQIRCDRHPTTLQQSQEAFQQSTPEAFSQIRRHLSLQGSHPMPLAAAGDPGWIPPITDPLTQAFVDARDARLKALKIPLRPQPHHAVANRTTKPLQIHRSKDPIKESGHKTMTPHPAGTTPWTALWLRPGIMTLLLNNGLEFHLDRDYHLYRILEDLTVILGCGKGWWSCQEPSHPFPFSANKNGPPPKGPFNPIIPISVSNYSEKIPPFQIQRF